jgi:hypothetical protein
MEQRNARRNYLLKFPKFTQLKSFFHIFVVQLNQLVVFLAQRFTAKIFMKGLLGSGGRKLGEKNETPVDPCHYAF